MAYQQPCSSIATANAIDTLNVSNSVRRITGEQKVERAGEFSDVNKGYLYSRSGQKVVAIKSLRGAPSYKKELIKDLRTKLEVYGRKWMKYNHPNILPFYGISTNFSYLPAMILPWLEEGNIMTYLMRRRADITESDKTRFVLQVCQGLKYLHDRGVVHGDLRSANILIDDSGNVRIADFQLVFIIDRSEFTTDKIAGTARWTAPELMDPRDSQDEVIQPEYTKMTDMFALAMTMIEIFTLKKPFASIRHEPRVIMRIMNNHRPELTEDEVQNPEIRRLIKQAWDEDPRNRPLISDACARVALALSRTF